LFSLPSVSKLTKILRPKLPFALYRRRPRGFRRKALKPFGAGSLYPQNGADCSPGGGRHHHVGSGHYDAAMAAHMAAAAANSGHHHHHHHHGVPVSVSDFEAAAAATLLPTTVAANGSNGGSGAFMLNNNVLSSYTGYGGGGYTPVDYPLPPIDARGPAADFADLGPAAPWPPCWGPGVAEAYQATPPPPSAGFASQVEAELALGKNSSIDFLLEKSLITLFALQMKGR
jgi:hypothetical protein